MADCCYPLRPGVGVGEHYQGVGVQPLVLPLLRSSLVTHTPTGHTVAAAVVAAAIAAAAAAAAVAAAGFGSPCTACTERNKLACTADTA